MDELVIIPKESSLLAEAEPHKFVIDGLFPHPHENVFDNKIRRRIATIFKVSKDEVHFRLRQNEDFTKAEISSLPSTKYDIIIRPRRLPMRYQFRALELLGQSDHVLSYLFPQKNPLRELKFEPESE